MGAYAALPEHLPFTLDKPILTFVVPAVQGCDLACPYCFIDQRKEEAKRPDLAPADYVTFIRQVAERSPIGALCIQGYEPLLDGAFAYTQAILQVGLELGLPTSLVTNGTHLAARAEALAALAPQKIAISLDAADAATHDKCRGKAGAFDAALAGISRVAGYPALRPILTIASILMPRRRERLLGMPALARSLGVDHWVVTVLQRVGRGEDLGGSVGARRQTFQDLLILKRAAEAEGLRFVVDDEFGTLSDADRTRDVVDINALRIRRLAHPAGVYRLLPNGQCSVGVQILQELPADAPAWRAGHGHAADFLASLQPGSAA